MHNYILLLLFLFANISCNSESDTSIVDDNQSTSETEEDLLSTGITSKEGADPAVKSVEELIDQIESSTEGNNEKPPLIPFDPPLTAAEIKGILQQCLQQILTEADFKSTREFYGTPGSTDIVLVNDSKLPWPADFNPKVKGFNLRFAQSISVDLDGNRVLGIRLEKLDVAAPNSGLFDGNITLVLSNVGGTKNGAVIGGSLTFFSIHRQGDTYVAKYSGSFDP